MSCWTAETFQATDGYPLAYRRYPAAGEAMAEVVCIHGIQSHAGWYEHSCKFLANQGFNVHFLDRRGSGANTIRRGDAPGFRCLLDDIAGFLQALPTNQGGMLPRYLIGISWGGKLAVALQKRHPGLVSGLALLCPGFCPIVKPPLLTRLAIAATRLVAPARKFEVPLNDPQLFTANPRWLDFLRNDPLALHRASARLLIESVRLDFYGKWAASRVTVPILVLLAGRDRIIDNVRTRRFVARFRGPVTIREYPDAHHTLEFEPNPEIFLADLASWLKAHGKVNSGE